jgi:transcription initiation factor TFIID subunit 13
MNERATRSKTPRDQAAPVAVETVAPPSIAPPTTPLPSATGDAATPRAGKKQKTSLSSSSSSSSRSAMSEDVEEMMYGFGDDVWPPRPDSVELMEKVVSNYIRNLCHRAVEISDLASMKLDKESFMFAVRKDSRKFNRVYTLLKSNEELRKAQKYDMTAESGGAISSSSASGGGGTGSGGGGNDD